MAPPKRRPSSGSGRLTTRNEVSDQFTTTGDGFMNERKTEAIVRKQLSELGYYDDPEAVVEEQKSDNPRINKLLTNASKKGDGAGHPEFLITSTRCPDLLMVIECKADVRKHVSKTLDKYAEYAVDGVLLYASFLSKEYDVVAVAVSGQTRKTARVDQYLYLRGAHAPVPFVGKKILSINDYYKNYIEHPSKFNQDYRSLLDYSRRLNKKLHKKKIKESQRSLLISSILIALQNPAFLKGYKGHRSAKQLAGNLVQTVVNELESSDIPKAKMENLKYAYSFIRTHTILSRDKAFLEGLIREIDAEINSFMKTHNYFDTLGQFYIEFLRYANNDKGLGIVLTPPHITALFSEIAEVNRDSVIVDNCCGTGGFLISAMKKMIQDAEGDSEKTQEIKQKQVFGVEFQTDIYALGISNMIIQGDGKSNIILDDCFENVDVVKGRCSPTIGFLNPPYKTEPSDVEEVEFVLNNLEMLQQNGKCVAIIPITCVLAQQGHPLELKRKLLDRHTLEAVMSMPEDLFHNSKVGVITCTIVLTAHVPHPEGKKTWFGYWRDDGFVKVKGKGRIDGNDKWEKIQRKWVNMFKNKESIRGMSLMKEVRADDEWCVEAYLKTDYSALTKDGYIERVRQYLAFDILTSEVES